MADNNAYIKTIKENELINGGDDSDVYPITSTQAIFSQTSEGGVPEGVKPKLEDRLKDHEDDAEELHFKSEKLKVVILNNKNNQTIEVTDNDETSKFTIGLVGSAFLETYGDSPDEVLNINDSTIISTKDIEKSFIVKFGNTNLEIASQGPGGSMWIGECDLSQGLSHKNIGTYTATFIVSYKGVPEAAATTRTIPSNTYIGLRMFAGFTMKESDIPAGSTIDTAINSWATLSPYLDRMDRNLVPHDAVVYTYVTFPAVPGDTGGANFDTRYIHFAIPAPLKLTKITQPDGLGQSLDFTDPHIVITRPIGPEGEEENYSYNLYRTTLPQGSYRQLRLDLTLSK